ncbi:MAG TPA: endonuclease/exonuclease/phosphatase family protein [Longimicrobiales bacterium]|nr:endonuclease/exonuclease/phosphatase family protein [Longimicrobiales bacterium]
MLKMLVFTLLAGCVTGQNYIEPAGPRYGGGQPVSSAPARLRGDTLYVVSYNIKFSIAIDSAIAAFRIEPEMRNADIVLLQEMDEDGTRRIAEALRMPYVYYPAQLRKNTGKDWGNAVLSRWPILTDSKLVLPNRAGLGRTLRTATATTLLIGSDTVRVYSTHLGTIMNVTPSGRREQLEAILEDARRFDNVIIGGDMNSETVGEYAGQQSFVWPTRNIPRSNPGGHLDHFFLKGFVLPESAAGTVLDNHHSSDHKPIWVKALLHVR